MFIFFFFNDTATTEIYTLSLHDALPIWFRSRKTATIWSHSVGRKPAITSSRRRSFGRVASARATSSRLRSGRVSAEARSEEHTSELQSPCNLVCRLLLEKKISTISDDTF